MELQHTNLEIHIFIGYLLVLQASFKNMAGSDQLSSGQPWETGGSFQGFGGRALEFGAVIMEGGASMTQLGQHGPS